MLWGMDALMSVYIALGTRTLLGLGHGCSGERMLLEHERYYGLGMDALVSVCSWNTSVVNNGLGMDALVSVCSWNTSVNYVWGMDALELLNLLLEHERYPGFGMDALVSVCSCFGGCCPLLSAAPLHGQLHGAVSTQ